MRGRRGGGRGDKETIRTRNKLRTGVKCLGWGWDVKKRGVTLAGTLWLKVNRNPKRDWGKSITL